MSQWLSEGIATEAGVGVGRQRIWGWVSVSRHMLPEQVILLCLKAGPLLLGVLRRLG